MPGQYYDLTEYEFNLMCDGYRTKQLEEKKTIRLQSWVVYMGYADPKTAPKSMEQWWPLPGDEKLLVKSRKLTKWELKKLNALDAKIRGKK